MKDRELISKYENWVMKICFSFLENPLFQPIGLDLSCVKIVIETNEDYLLNGIKDSAIAAKLYPVAYYKPSDDSIHIFIEHECFQKRTTDFEKFAFLLFVLFHEANHRLLVHIRRGKDKDHMIWNIAADMEIHNTLFIYYQVMKNNSNMKLNVIYKCLNESIAKFLFQKKDTTFNEGLFEPEYLNNVAEEIYIDLLESKKEEEKTYEIEGSDGESVSVTTMTVTTKSGKKYNFTDVNFPKESASNEEKENGVLTRKTLMENTLQKYAKELAERSKGDLSQMCQSFLKKLFHVKIDWKKILRSSLMTALDTSEYFSWAKPRISMFGLPELVYLPSTCEDNEAYGTLIIVRDESGSMSDDDCRKAAGIIKDSKEFYKKIILIKHDISISSVNEFEEMNNDAEKLLLSRESFGGTSHQDVFKWISDYDRKHHEDDPISCCIFLTDMFSDITEFQNLVRKRIPKIYLYPKSVEKYSEFSKYLKGVDGKTIAIE